MRDTIKMCHEIVEGAQTIFYVVTPFISLTAVLVTYLALSKQSKPRLLVHYQPNSKHQSIIDLIVENIGNGMAIDVTFSQPLPARCYGIEKPEGEASEVLSNGLPAIAAGQKYVFDGGQYGGLSVMLDPSLEIRVSYMYKNPFGITRKRTETCILSIEHLKYMTTRPSAEAAIVDALKGPNTTTLQQIREELSFIHNALSKISKNDEKEDE